MVDQHRRERRSPARRVRGARSAREHHRRVPLRQRCVSRGRGPGYRAVPAHGDHRSARGCVGIAAAGPRAARRARRADHAAALPARLGHGVGHAVAAVQAAHVRRRPHGAVHRRRSRGAGRPPEARALPVPARHRPAADAHRARRARRARSNVTGVPVQDRARVELRRSARRCGTAPSTHPEQHYAMLGHRGYYRDGWEVVTNHRPFTPFGDHEWSLFDVRDDPTQRSTSARLTRTRSPSSPRHGRPTPGSNQVYPLDEGAGVVWITRPPGDDVYSRPVTLRPGTPTLERWRARSSSRPDRSSSRSSSMSPGDGVLVAHGDQGGGYSLAIEDGEAAVRLQRVRRAAHVPCRPARRGTTARGARRGGAGTSLATVGDRR